MKKTVFLTGATGNMSKEGLKQLIARSDKFNITLLVLPSPKDKAIKAQLNPDKVKLVYMVLLPKLVTHHCRLKMSEKTISLANGL